MSTVEQILPKIGATPVEIRYVLFCPHSGIYLGDGHWSFANHGGKNSAPTFSSKYSVKDLMDECNNGCEMRMVHPDQDDNKASVFACANAGLPRWDPHDSEKPAPEKPVVKDPPKSGVHKRP